MATTANSSISFFITVHNIPKNPLGRRIISFTSNHHRPSFLRRHLKISNVHSATPDRFVSRFSPDQPRTGGDVLVEALEQKGVKAVFEYPGGASWEIQETKLKCLVDLPRRSTGYSKTAFTPSCSRALTSTSPPVLGWSGENQETNLSGVAEWTFENFQMAAEEGWPVVIPREGEGTSSKWIFWYVMNGDEEGNGRICSCCHVCVLGKRENYIESKKPVLYVGGGCLNSSEELRRFVEFTGIPVASTLMVLRAYPVSDDDMSLGMHGTVYAIYAI